MSWSRLRDAAAPLQRSLDQAFADPRSAQERLLGEILEASRDSLFGREHGFARISGPEDYRRQVPIRSYEEFRPYMERIAAGEPGILTSEEVVAFEETGGSSGAAKLIPYTRRSLASFGAAILPWIADLLRARPGIAKGRAYFAISPATRMPRTTPSGIPVGLPSDDAYLGDDLAGVLASLSVVPPEVAAIRDVDDWALLSAAHLVAAEDLSFISVWSPTFFSGLLRTMRLRTAEIETLLRKGAPGLAANPSRAEQLARALEAGRLDASLLWPRLDAISAWEDAASAPYARALRDELPGIFFQGKGLLATEGVITVPLSLAPHPLPALTSTFLEFVDAERGVKLAHELETGKTYRVLLTNRGGLFRYDIGDVLACCGRFGWSHMGPDGAPISRNPMPMLRFVGRAGAASDLVGEKLTEAFVLTCLAAARGFAALFPIAGPPARYGLAIEKDGPDEATGIAESVDRALRRNPHYDYACRQGQLAALRAFPIVDAQARYITNALRQGRRLSDIKPPALIVDAALPSDIWLELGNDPGTR